MKCEHRELAPKRHEDGIERPACVDCGRFVVRGSGGVTVDASQLMAILGKRVIPNG